MSGKRFEAEALLYAVGRNGNTEELGLERIGLTTDVMALGGRVEYLVANVFNYPTLAECYKIAALDAFNKISGAEPSTRAATAGASDTGPADGSSAAD